MSNVNILKIVTKRRVYICQGTDNIDMHHSASFPFLSLIESIFCSIMDQVDIWNLNRFLKFGSKILSIARQPLAGPMGTKINLEKT